jgi:hypothetical protein
VGPGDAVKRDVRFRFEIPRVPYPPGYDSLSLRKRKVPAGCSFVWALSNAQNGEVPLVIKIVITKQSLFVSMGRRFVWVTPTGGIVHPLAF